MDISRDIGTYMLQGWILTNDACPKCIYPLMRSPAARSPPETFCVNCDGGPTGSSTKGEKTYTSQPIIAQASEEASAHTESASSSSHRSRASTPPTEVSEPPHNAGDDFDPLPPPSEEVLQRRAQSDYASAEIGKLLLRGYAMLADECPNLTCYGVPLVRPPKTPDGGPSANKECVVCRSVYVYGSDGRSLVAATVPIPQNLVANSNASIQPLSRALAEGITQSKEVTSADAPSTQAAFNDASLQVSDPLQQTLLALEHSLTVLASRMRELASPPALTNLNTAAMTDVAKTMDSVLSALNKAKQLK